jgi:hypothetical protein
MNDNDTTYNDFTENTARLVRRRAERRKRDERRRNNERIIDSHKLRKPGSSGGTRGTGGTNGSGGAPSTVPAVPPNATILPFRKPGEPNGNSCTRCTQHNTSTNASTYVSTVSYVSTPSRRRHGTGKSRLRTTDLPNELGVMWAPTNGQEWSDRPVK